MIVIECRSVEHAKRVAANLDALDAWLSGKRPQTQAEYDLETLRLTNDFAAIDMCALDGWSLTGCRRNAPEGS